jgi:pilus assembly protein FimV
MSDLQSQLDKLQRLIELKNNQLAKLQAEGGANAPTAATTAPAMSAELTAGPAATPADAVPAPTPEAAAPEAVPAPAVEPAPATSDDQKFNELLTNPILLGLVGGGAVVLLLLLLLLARRRKAQQEAEKHLRMARALEEQEFSVDQDLPESSFEGLEVPPPSVKLATAPTPAPAPAPVIAPVVVTPPIAAPLVSPAAERSDRSDDVLAQAQSHIAGGRLNQAAALLEDAIKQEPQRSDLRLKLMEVYGQQGDRDAFVAQERQLVANGDNFARVEELKSRFPAMAVVAASGLAAAAIAAELDAQYVKDLLLDEPQAPEPALSDFDSAFDLSLDDLEAVTPIAPVVAAEPEPAPESTPAPEALAELDEFPLDDDLSFESVLQQQTEIKENLDDLSDFDLDMDLGGDASPATLAEDDFLLSLDEDLKDLPATEAPTVTEAVLDDLELPADFDLSLADEMDAAPDQLDAFESDQPDAFESELNDVNAELDRLSQSLGEPSFTAEDALATAADEPDFDFLSGTDEVATKLDLAQAYIDMGDNDGARDILNEVVTEGDAGQKSEAKEMLSRLA